jgi:hypothetical protein
MGRETNMSLALVSLFWIFDLLFMLLLPLGPGESQPWNESARDSTAKGSAIMRGIWMFLGPLWWTPAAGEHLDVQWVHVVLYVFTSSISCSLIAILPLYSYRVAEWIT